MTRGRSLGGITARATIATTNILPMSKSNIGAPAERAPGRRGRASPSCERQHAIRSADLVHVAGLDARTVLDRAGSRRRSALRRFLLVVLGEALLEGFHPFGDVAHDVGDLAFASE